ncbi:HpcH/HpaI aldolase/citrate lyase family protein [Brevundimonas sp.]|uniref:HpcH/HpaI aldolase/citrate lyase family protein n=1 Tax=Brevundimonas sp. TaxID=1871086 RepID=UPI003BAD65EE
MTMLPQSWLFVPGSRPDRFAKAANSGAGAVILDLEDAVAEADKETARDHVLQGLVALVGESALRAVRINPLTRAVGLLDLAAIAGSATSPDFVVIPKVEHPEQVRLAAAVLSEAKGLVGLIALIESAAGLARVAEIGLADPALRGLMFGAADYAADMGQTVGAFDDRIARSLVANGAALGGVIAIDSPWFDMDDLTGLEAGCVQARQMGFSAKAAIHPKHLQAIHAHFGWSDEERERAGRILTAAPDGVGVLDGRMVDRAMVRWAQRVARQFEA